MREAVPDVAELALLNVLLDGVECLLLGDLLRALVTGSVCVGWTARDAGNGRALTSILALVQRGTSTIMLRTVCCSLAYSGMSCHGETGWPSFSMKTRCSSVLAAPILRTV